MGEARGTDVLGEVVDTLPMYRQRALTALAAIDDLDADDALEKLLHVDSVETRYGAFRAIRQRDPDDPLIPQLTLDGDFHMHVVASTGEPLVHLAWRERPEIVLFGDDIELKLPALIFAGKRIMIDGRQGDAVKVSVFRQQDGDTHEHCSARMDDILGVVARLGGTYPEVVQLLRQARDRDYLTARLAFDSVPEIGGASRETRLTATSPSLNLEDLTSAPIQHGDTGTTDREPVEPAATEQVLPADLYEPYATPKRDEEARQAPAPAIYSRAKKTTEKSHGNFDKIEAKTDSDSFAEAFE